MGKKIFYDNLSGNAVRCKNWKTLLNCFGALIMASGLFGVGTAIVLRIVNNVAGCCFGIFFYYVYHWIMDWLDKKRGGAGLQSVRQ